MLPDMTRLSSTQAEEQGALDFSSQEGCVSNGRYFYLLHRPADSSEARPEAAARIMQSGGVGADRYASAVLHQEVFEKLYRNNKSKLEQLEEPLQGIVRAALDNPATVKHERAKGEEGLDPNIKQYLQHFLNDESRLTIQTSEQKRLVSWWYLNSRHGVDVLTLASPDELVFRVPELWLLQNALSCMELLPRKGGDLYSWPWAFLTPLVIPGEFRIVSPIPLPDESHSAMTGEQVGDVVYSAHVAQDPESRNPQ
jgi:hypothetical protein